ncbi:MAG: DUF1097 family protein [Lachnospiraceae bacterium]|nr:DUF1097 family protein [Candidatus Equihabitans merdae]
MKLKQQVVYALLTAILAGVVTYVTEAMSGAPVANCAGNGLTYISFCTWACYFVCGLSIKGAANWLYSMVVGEICAILMFVLTVAFLPSMGFLVGVSVAVIIIVFFMMFYDKLIINGAALFIGTGLFFSVAAAGGCPNFAMGEYMQIAIAEIIYTVIGLAAGWVTIWFAGLASKIK